MSGRKFSQRMGPFALVPLWVADALEPDDRAVGIAVWVTLWRYATNDDLEAWPSRETIGAHVGKSPATVKRTVAKLEAIGALARTGQTASERSGRWGSQRYVLHVDRPTAAHG